ncbi:hypothetical protein [Holdemanella biformis]|uniref:hypothetical protein n=1 Tax=Holdemanella biformis TaxID=1735 RepID=UPI0026753CFA|nr:hypothetical protein [Holdemanella biformis]
MEDANEVKYGIKNVYVVPIESGEGGDITYGTPVAWKGFESVTLEPEGDTNSNNGCFGSIEMHPERTDEFTITERKSVSEKSFLGVKKMKYKLPKFLTEVKKFFLIHNTESLFVQWEDCFACVYKSGSTLIRDVEGVRLHKKHICESQFKSLYRKFLDNEIETCNYEDIMDGCKNFYLNSEEEYKKFLRIFSDL